MSGNHHHQQQDAGRAEYSTIDTSGGASKSSAAGGEVKPFPQDALTIGGSFLARMSCSSGGVSNSRRGKIAKMGVDSSAGSSGTITMGTRVNTNSKQSSSSSHQRPTVTPIRPALANTTQRHCNVAAPPARASTNIGIPSSNGIGSTANPIVPGGVGGGGRRRHLPTKQVQQQPALVPAAVSFRSPSVRGGGKGSGNGTANNSKGSAASGGNEGGHGPEYGIIGSGCGSSNVIVRGRSGASTSNSGSSNILFGGSSSNKSSNNSGNTIHPPPGLTNNNIGGTKTGRNGLGHRTMTVVSPLSLRGDAAHNNSNTCNTTATTTANTCSNVSGTSNKTTTKVATLKLSTQSSLYSPRAGNTTSATSTAATTRQLQWFTPIKQDETDKTATTTKGGSNAMASITSIATPTTVATTPSHRSSSVLDSSSLLSGGGATPVGGGGGGGCFLSSICSIDDDETATRSSTATTSNARSILGRSRRSSLGSGWTTTPKIPAVVTSISSNHNGGRDSIVSPLPILSDVTNKDGSANGSGINTSNDNNANIINDGFITPRKADRNAANNRPPTPLSVSSSSTKGTRSTSPAGTPPPQNLKGDPRRQNKVKTELCLYYLKDVPCPFGERCNYAHGWDELRFKKLKDLERNGLVPNASQYRTHPCLSWITTGSCPFGQRCSSIHDPRVAGPVSSW